jgi:antitoxin HigA-1
MGHYPILNSKGKEIASNILLHPGEVLAEELVARNLVKSAFAMKIGIYPAHFYGLLKGKRNISAAIALKLEKELNISAEFWMGMQMDYDIAIQRKIQKAA